MNHQLDLMSEELRGFLGGVLAAGRPWGETQWGIAVHGWLTSGVEIYEHLVELYEDMIRVYESADKTSLLPEFVEGSEKHLAHLRVELERYRAHLECEEYGLTLLEKLGR
jgi:hypothetical protein